MKNPKEQEDDEGGFRVTELIKRIDISYREFVESRYRI
jgi:hypothetical protein